MFNREIGLFGVAMSALAVIIFITAYALFGKRQSIRITKIDVILDVLLLYIVARAALQGFGELDPIAVLSWSALGLIYIVARLLQAKQTIILNIISFSALVQAVIAILQKAGYVASEHSMFDVTGTFGNPGQLGGFLAIGFVVCFALMATSRYKIIYGLPAVIIAAGLWLADSRASCVAVVVGLLVLFGRQIWSYSKPRLKYLLPATIVFIVAASLFIYNYRPASADSRLLVWRVATEMALGKPLFGGGVGSFERSYVLAQANYFADNPDSRFVMVADNVAYPYNEFIHIAVELGLIGLLLVAVLLWFVFRAKGNISVKAPIAAFLAFSLFSYPSYVLPIMIVFVVLLGLIEGKPIFTIKYNRWLLSIIVIIALGVGVIYAKELSFYRSIPHGKELFDEQNIERLKNNPYFMHRLAAYWGANHDKFDERFVDNIPPSCENWCDLGDIYAEQGDYAKAEHYYRTASKMIPTRLRPNYLLWEMQLRQGDTTNAIATAKHILSQPIKVEGTYTIRSKAEVLQWLENRQ